MLLAREAEANGVVVGNGAVNEFLSQWTNNMVRPEQLESLISGRRFGQMPVTTADVFAALRTVLAADRMRQLSFAGFAGDPPGARWDILRRLEQEATIEVVPVVVESFANDVPAPAEPALRALFDRFKDRLPVDRSPDPGFREPHRISYDWLVADRAELETAAEKDVTDAEIEAFYAENKIRLYRTKSTDAAADQKKSEDGKQDDADKADAQKKDEKPDEKKDDAEKKPDDTDDVEPLEKVRDDIRKRLAASAVDRRIDGLFSAVTADVAGFSRDLSRWKAESGSEASKPAPPSRARRRPDGRGGRRAAALTSAPR